MPTFSTGFTTPAAATAAAYATQNASAARRNFLRELGCSTTAATASSVGMGVPANTPVVTTSIVPQPHDAADAASTGVIGTAWSTAPTAPTVFFRKQTLGAAVGAAFIYKLALDERIILAKSAFWVWWNYGASTAAALDCYCEYDE
jgi:hypothetical protein